MSETTARVTEYKKAILKFNNGYGALLCNACNKVVKTGFDHPDDYYYCSDECKPPEIPATYGYQYNSEDYFG